ncbi:hypothetical protein [Serpentinicella alkaliphila]|uniref:Putative ribosomally synthesized peptide with SipW-like signal peptide n=1 Tax=Serpentinicella alkaliphila TaxID=1734049 RepID=A0A4R2UA69_9FIRM|nr:hypothetical protein [Serpentinicella alkaliphila]QUH25267.1 hypothetical protein HZR23_05470 [Serpentinicella alkaliphila]TCQ07079.1 putative ribosomally synthesized peptide with SipW-like signal peptide [Serpentinicella alkaliphila]
MKKTKFIAMALVVAVMMMGAGYAFWTDQLTITSTVSTGEFRVDFTGQGMFGKERYKANPNAYASWRDGHYMGKADNVQDPGTFIVNKVDDKSLEVKISNMYPGTMVKIAAKAQNNGTIPAVVNNVEIENINVNDKLAKVLEFSGKAKILRNNGSVESIDVPNSRLGGADGKTSLEDALNSALKGIRLEPGESVEFSTAGGGSHALTIELPVSVKNEDDVENAIANFKIIINWEQHNAKYF